MESSSVQMRWLLIFPLALVGLFFLDRYASRSGLDAEDILSVQPGMTMDQVNAILGEPKKHEIIIDYRFYCQCNSEKMCYDPNRTTWTFTKKPITSLFPYPAYPMLWVHFNSRGHVASVYVKKYMGFDDRGIYFSKLDPCDPMDRTIARLGRPIDEANAIRRLKELF